MGRSRETELYGPVKGFLESQGLEVKAEVGPADVVGIDGDRTVIVELKLGFSLVLLQQAVKRQQITDDVYVAVPRWSGRQGWKAFRSNVGLCRRLGIGVLAVADDGSVEVQAEPGPFVRRKSKARRTRLLDEFERRQGDPNEGGTNGKIVTAYHQDAERCARYLLEYGVAKGADVASATGVDRATRMMRDNVYGWFERVGHGEYRLAAAGAEALSDSQPIAVRTRGGR